MQKNINILGLLQNILGTKLGELVEMSKGYFAHTGHFSLTNLSRWVSGMSLRSIERFYASAQDWHAHVFMLVAAFLSGLVSDSIFLKSGWCLVLDETVGKKSGNETHGLGFHYSSKDDKVIKSIAVLSASLVHQSKQVSLPMCREQLVFTTCGETVSKRAAKKVKVPEAGADKKPVGRPKGSKNKVKTAAEKLPAYTFQVFERILGIFSGLFGKYLSGLITYDYIVCDGGFGNNTVVEMCLAQGKHLISKLHYNAALYSVFSREQKSRGRKRIYGEKLDYDTLSVLHADKLIDTQIQKDGSLRYVYQFENMVHKSFDKPINIVLIVKCDKAGKMKNKYARIVLFTTDPKATAKTVTDFYQVRFQIEFNFRDARQYFGLSHFKNIKEKQVGNVIGFSFFMVALSNILIFKLREINPTINVGIQDIKAFFRAEKYCTEILNSMGFDQTQFLNLNLIENMPVVGLINAA